MTNLITPRALFYYISIEDGPTGNNAIRSADPEKSSLEPNMEWIGCTICEIFAFKVYCDLDLGVTQGHRKRHHSITLYKFILVFHSKYTYIHYRFRDIAEYWSKIATVLVFGAPVRGEAVKFTQQPLVTKN